MSSKDIEKALKNIYPDIRENPSKVDFSSEREYGRVKPIRGDSTMSYLFIFIVILTFILFGFVVIYSFFMNVKESKEEPEEDNNANIGALIDESYYKSATTEVRSNSKKAGVILANGENDKCDYGYYTGNSKSTIGKCKFQAHDYNYYNIGMMNMNYTKLAAGKHMLSMAEKSQTATQICDSMEDCKGVEYNHITYDTFLITSDVIVNEMPVPKLLNYSSDVQVYLKKTEAPHFPNIVFGYSGPQILRYYSSNSPNVIKFIPGLKVELPFIPSSIINHGGLKGKYYNEYGILVYEDSNVGEYNLPFYLNKCFKLHVIYE